MHTIIFILALQTFLTFTIASIFIFKSSISTSPLQNLLSLSAATAVIYYSWMIWTNEANGIMLHGLVGLLFLSASLIFVFTYLQHRNKRIAFAFSGEYSDHLVETGPYKYIRHPYYLSYILANIASTLYVQNTVAILFLVVNTVLYFSAAKREESSFLEHDRLAEQYKAYRTKTGMIFPAMPVLKNRSA